MIALFLTFLGLGIFAAPIFLLVILNLVIISLFFVRMINKEYKNTPKFRLVKVIGVPIVCILYMYLSLKVALGIDNPNVTFNDYIYLGLLWFGPIVFAVIYKISKYVVRGF